MLLSKTNHNYNTENKHFIKTYTIEIQYYIPHMSLEWTFRLMILHQSIFHKIKCGKNWLRRDQNYFYHSTQSISNTLKKNAQILI